MAEEMGRESEEQRIRRRATTIETSAAREGGAEGNYAEAPHYASALLTDASIGERGNDSVRQAAMQTMQSNYGNRAVQRFVQGGGASVQRFTEPTPWMNSSPFVEPTPWAGHGGRHSDWNGMPSGPNLGIEPYNPGAG